MKVVSTVYETSEMECAEFTVGLFEDEFGEPLLTADGKVVAKAEDLLPLLERALAGRSKAITVRCESDPEWASSLLRRIIDATSEANIRAVIRSHGTKWR